MVYAILTNIIKILWLIVLIMDSIRKKEFASIPFLDFNKFELNKEDYADLEHLNFKGANKFSKWFDNLLMTININYI